MVCWLILGVCVYLKVFLCFCDFVCVFLEVRMFFDLKISCFLYFFCGEVVKGFGRGSKELGILIGRRRFVI